RWHEAGNYVRDEHDHQIAEIEHEWEWQPGYGERSRDDVMADARFIARARADVPALCDALELAWQQNSNLGKLLEASWAQRDALRKDLSDALDHQCPRCADFT